MNPENFSTDEIQRLNQLLDMESLDVELTTDADVQHCLNLLTGTATISGERTSANNPQQQVQHRFSSPRFVGKGSFGIVFLVFDQTLGMDVAIKLLRPSRNSPIVQQRFLAEARITASLTHPGIIRMYDSGLIGSVPYITSAIAADGSLADWNRRYACGMPPRLACQILAQVAEAVAYAHAKLTYHRDIKPSNILMVAATKNASAMDAASDPEVAQPVLTDFGLAKRWDRSSDALTMEGDILGTARYMSPEQASGDLDQYSVKSEVFTLGVILFEMLTGTVPFRGKSSTEVRKSILQDRPIALRSLQKTLAKDLVAIVAKCLEKPPEHRYESVSLLVKDLRRFLAGEPVEASQPSLLRLVIWQSKQHPWLASSLLLTCLTICLAVSGVSYAWYRQYISSLREHQTKVDYVISLGKLVDDVISGEKDQQTVMLETLHAFETKLDGDLSANPRNQKLRHLVSVIQHYKATVLSRSGKTEEAMFCRVKSIAHLKTLRDNNPTNTTYRFQFLYGIATISEVMHHTGLNQVRQELARLIGVADAKEYALLVIQEIDQFLHDFDIPDYTDACNEFRTQVAILLLQNAHDLALEQIQLAIRSSMKLADQHPDSPNYIKSALSGMWILAGDASQQNDLAELEVYASQANATFEKYLRPHYHKDWVRAEFAIRQSWYAVELCYRGSFEEAFSVAEKARLANDEFLENDASYMHTCMRDFKLHAVLYKSSLELGRTNQADAFYSRLRSSVNLIVDEELVRQDCLNLASLLNLPDEIQAVLRAAR